LFHGCWRLRNDAVQYVRTWCAHEGEEGSKHASIIMVIIVIKKIMVQTNNKKGPAQKVQGPSPRKKKELN